MLQRHWGPVRSCWEAPFWQDTPGSGLSSLFSSQESQSTVVHNPPDGVKVRSHIPHGLLPSSPLSGGITWVSFSFALDRGRRRAMPPTMRRRWKVWKVLRFVSFPSVPPFSFCPPLDLFRRSVCVFPLCWLPGVPRHTVSVCVCARERVDRTRVCVCVLADSSTLSQSSATEEMPPLLPSNHGSPASKCNHGNQKLCCGHWRGPNPLTTHSPPWPPTPSPTPNLLLPSLCRPTQLHTLVPCRTFTQLDSLNQFCSPGLVEHKTFNQ